MLGTSLHTNSCKGTIALETAEIMQLFFNHRKLLRRMNYCKNYCARKELLQQHPLRNPPLLRTPKIIVRNDTEKSIQTSPITWEDTLLIIPLLVRRAARLNSCDSKVVAHCQVALNVDRLRLGFTILILRYCDSTHFCALVVAQILLIPGLRFWNRAIRAVRFCAAMTSP